MNPKIAKKIIYLPIQHILGHNLEQCMDELLNLETFHSAHIEDYKDKKIKELIIYIVEKIPYYNKRVSINKILKTNNIYDMLSELPILTKNILRENSNDFIDQSQKLSYRSTSGTTGSPLIFPKDKNALAYMDAMMHIAYSWHGIDIGDRQSRFWGSSVNIKGKGLQLLKDFLLNRKRLSAFNMTETNCVNFYNCLMRFKPKYFYGYSNALFLFASNIKSSKLDAMMLGVKIIIATGEVLFKHQRELIRDVFGCAVINEYGTTENGIIGFECEYGNMHIMPTIYIEIVSKDEEGYGEILVTELNSRTLPFLRYKTGDRGRLLDVECQCGRPYQLIELFEGRIDSFIKCTNGKLVYDSILAYILKDYALQFRANQKNVNTIDITIIPKIHLTEKNTNRIKNHLKKYVGEVMEINIIEVTSIPADPSGKKRYFVSQL